LALGASGALIGRPVIIYAIGGGETGVSMYLEDIKKQLEKTMIMTGCHNLNSIVSNIIFSKE